MAYIFSPSRMFAPKPRAPVSFLTARPRAARARLAQEAPFVPQESPRFPPDVPPTPPAPPGPAIDYEARQKAYQESVGQFGTTPPVRDEWSDEEDALKQAFLDTLPKIPARDKGGQIIKDTKGDPVMTANPVYLDYKGRLRALKLARAQWQQVLETQRRQRIPIRTEITRPFPGGYPAIGRYEQRVDDAGELVGPEIYLGSTPDEARIARDIAQQRAAALTVIGEDVRQDPETGKWHRVTRFRNPLTGDITEQVGPETTPPLAYQQFEFQKKQADWETQEVLRKQREASAQEWMQRLTGEVRQQRLAREKEPFRVFTSGAPFDVSPPGSGQPGGPGGPVLPFSGTPPVRVSAMVTTAQNIIKMLTANPGALSEEHKAALLREFAPMFQGQPGAVWSTFSAGGEPFDAVTLRKLLQPSMGGFAFARPAVRWAGAR